MSDLQVLRQSVMLFAEECDRGNLRQVNQDFVLHVRVPLGELLIVADGVGGDNSGVAGAAQMAAQLFHAYLSVLPANYPVDNAIREAAAHANAKITPVDKSPDVPQLRVGTAVIVALLQLETEGAHAWIGHIGDCRAYLIRAGRLHRLTVDHSGVQSLLSRSLIAPEEVYRHPDTPVLTRSLGAEAEVEIDVEEHPLALGDTLLLCSDGLWNAVPEKEIERIATEGTPDASTHQLLQRALSAGGHDNISIEMVRMSETRAIPASKTNARGNLFKWLLALFLLALLGAGLLTYFTFSAG